MSDASDVRVENSDLLAKEQASIEQVQELARNFLHRVGVDGSKDFNALQYLQGIASSLSLLGLQPQNVAVVDESDTDDHVLIPCLPNQRIFIFDLFTSINAAAVISYKNSISENVFGPMYAPNDGQGFSFSSQRGIQMKRGEPVVVASDTAVSYSVTASYAIIEDVDNS